MFEDRGSGLNYWKKWS